MKTAGKAVLTAAGIVSALGVLGTAAWTAGDFTETRPVILKEFKIAQQEDLQTQKMLLDQIQQNQQIVLVLQFDQLEQKRKFGFLSFDEIQKRCQIAEALKYVLVEGCK